MDREKRKLELLQSKYEQLKKKIKDWEVAIYKTVGKQPDKNDMKSAPTDVQESYRELVKIRKYLEEALSRPIRKNEAAATPGKIFAVGKHRRQLQRTDHVYLTPVKTLHKNKAPLRQLKEAQKPSLGLRSSASTSESSSSTTHKDNEPSGCTRPFQKLFALARSTETISTSLERKKVNTDTAVAVPKEDSSSQQENELSEVGRKRPSSFAFASSPEKQKHEMKFAKPSFFNSEDLRKTVDEVLNETSQSSQSDTQLTDSVMDGSSLGNSNEISNETSQNDQSNATSADAEMDDSLLCSFSEDACFPPETEQDEFSTIDTSMISNLIQSLSDSIDEDTSKSNQCSSSYGSGSGSCQGSEDSQESRKRIASFAFSPSPEKPTKARKFFKSDRGARVTRAAFSINSIYKPPSPLKQFRKKSEPSPSPSLAKSRKSTRAETINRRGSGQLSSRLLTDKNTDDKSNECDKDEYSEMEIDTKKKPGRVLKKINYDESEDASASVEAAAPETKKPGVVDIFDEVPQHTSKKKVKGRRFNARNQTLETKMSKGKLEDNYVRIDTTKKVFVRGHKKISAIKMKRLDWKHRKSVQGRESATKTFTCHKCGEKGHFSKFCPQNAVTTEEAPGEVDNSPFPTIEEAVRMVHKTTTSNTNTRTNIYMPKTTEDITAEDDGNEVDGSKENCNSDAFRLQSQQEPVGPAPQLLELVDPFFSSEDSSCPDEEEQIMKEGVEAFGYENFRTGQREAIHRVLKGLSTLLILSTGTGKSLCYQLPAYLYQKKYPGAMTLCVSPLVSLMEDQVQGIPPFLNAACLHGGMTAKQKSVVLDKVKSKKLHILLVSPEAVCGGLFGLLKGNSDNLPTISFACIDEVHCVSQWSHNFRPSYLQLCKILREKLNVKTILGLTATATETTARSICEHLNIDPSTTIRGELIPRNLQLSVSRDVYKDEALLNLLRGERFRDCDSIIIYCTRREECERISTLVRTKMQEISIRKVTKTKSAAKLSGTCEAYHAGMTPRRRKNVQIGFMSGDIRIVVATVAFGMGIDKSDIRAVIHYNMPSAFESYVQEIGRAGRDGLPAHCHLFLDNSRRSDLSELKRHVYANSVDRPTIRKLLRKVFQPCKCKRIETLKGNTEGSSDTSEIACPGHEVSFSVDNTVTDLDLPKENITTLLCYLELGERKWIEILPLTYETCTIQSYVGAKLLKSAASRCPPLAVAIALQKEKNKFRDTDTYLEFNVIEAAATVGWSSSVVKRELKQLEWMGSQFDDKGNPTRFRKSGILVEFSGLAYRVKSGSLTDDEADEVLNSLHGRNVTQEQTELYQLQRVYQALLSVSLPNVNNLCDTYDEEKSNQLKKFIYEYFSESSETIQTGTEAVHALDPPLDPGKEEDLRRSIRLLIDSNRDVNFTTRSIARIFQGISSPCFPADVWYRNRDFWRRFLDIDFHVICRIASTEL